jgi:flagellar hook assembly protein FlgD
LHGDAQGTAGGNIVPAGDAKAGIQLAGANPSRTQVLQYSIPANGHVRLELFAANGRLVRTLVDQDAAAGSFRAVWDGRDNGGSTVGRGVYFARYTVNGQKADDKKLVLE